MTARRPARALTVFAVGFLLLDAVLLLLAGVWFSRPILIVWSVVFAAGAIGVVILWRHYLVQLEQLEDARRALRDEAQRIRRALGSAQR